MTTEVTPVRRAPAGKRRGARFYVGRTLTYFLLVVGGLVILAPFLWLLRSVFTPDDILYSQNADIIPERFTFDQIKAAFTQGILPFNVYFVNSLIVTAIAVISNVIFCGLAGFALARLRFRGRTILLAVIVLMLGVPIESRIIPLYLMATKTQLSNSYLGIVLPLLVTSLGIFLMRQYVMTIPFEIDEAARVDGASVWRLYWQIIVPICRPVLAAIAIFSFITAWNDYLWPLVIVQSQDMQTLPLAVANLAVVKDQLRWGTLLAYSLLSALPVLIFYIFLQKQFVAGIAGGAVKG